MWSIQNQLGLFTWWSLHVIRGLDASWKYDSFYLQTISSRGDDALPVASGRVQRGNQFESLASTTNWRNWLCGSRNLRRNFFWNDNDSTAGLEMYSIYQFDITGVIIWISPLSLMYSQTLFFPLTLTLGGRGTLLRPCISGVGMSRVLPKSDKNWRYWKYFSGSTSPLASRHCTMLCGRWSHESMCAMLVKCGFDDDMLIVAKSEIICCCCSRQCGPLVPGTRVPYSYCCIYVWYTGKWCVLYVLILRW